MLGVNAEGTQEEKRGKHQFVIHRRRREPLRSAIDRHKDVIELIFDPCLDQFHTVDPTQAIKTL